MKWIVRSSVGTCARLRVMRLVCAMLLFGSGWAVAGTFPSTFAPLEWWEEGGWVARRSEPAAVCADYAHVWGWDKNDYSFAYFQDLPGTGRCQRFYQGALEPTQYTRIYGACQDAHAKPLSELSGKYVSYPDYNRTTGVCSCSTGNGFDASIEWCVPQCPATHANAPTTFACVPVLDRYHGGGPKPGCPVGHPIYPLLGSKSLTEPLGVWKLGGQGLVASYDTRSRLPSNDGTRTFTPQPAAAFGPLWFSSFHKSLVPQLDGSGTVQAVQLARGNGDWLSFVRNASGQYLADGDVTGRLIAVGGGWRFVDDKSRSVETYDGNGRLLSVSGASGETLSHVYSDSGTPASIAPSPGLLIVVRDQTGRSVQFRYASLPVDEVPRITQIVDPSGQSVAVTYESSGELKQLTWTDGTSREYLHERNDLPWAITGTRDESTRRLATYGYDAQGRAIDTQWAGGADRYNVAYTTPPTWSVIDTFDAAASVIWRDHYWGAPSGVSVTDPGGSVRTLSVSLIQGKPYQTGQSQPAGAGCAASTRVQSFDANGNLVSRNDFNGTRSCFANDAVRNLELGRVEGLGASQDCVAVTSANGALPAGARKTSTQWHPDWRLQSKVAAPGQITTNVYNGQPDPFAGNAMASCAPSTATLPDGNPIAVLCKVVEQATTDADGHLGFGASLQAGPPIRVRTWTYNERGQVLTAKGTRSSDTTTYTYHATTDANHTVGDLATMTDAAGKTTTYDKYDKLGQLLQSTDSDGVVTLRTYDARQRLLTSTVGTETTTYTYDPVGQLTQVTQPDGRWIGYEYDDAHRQTAVKDSRGNRIEYQLDNAGQQIGQTAKDPTGSLKRNLARAMDALGRVQQGSGRE